MRLIKSINAGTRTEECKVGVGLDHVSQQRAKFAKLDWVYFNLRDRKTTACHLGGGASLSLLRYVSPGVDMRSVMGVFRTAEMLWKVIIC